MTTHVEQAQPSSYPPQGHPPPPPYQTPYGGAPPVQQQPQQPVMVAPQPVTYVVQIPNFGPSPTGATCPACLHPVVTVITYQSGSLTWLICIIIALIGGWMGCCLIPFCFNECKDVIHSCPNCYRQLGLYRRLS